jgi:hypothetical protein
MHRRRDGAGGLVATSGRVDVLGTPGRFGIVHSRCSGPCGFSRECFSAAASRGSHDLWLGVIIRPIGMPIQTLVLCLSHVACYEEGDREDQGYQEYFG